MYEKLILRIVLLKNFFKSKVAVSFYTLLSLFLVVKLFNYASNEKEIDDPTYQKMFNDNYKIFSLNLPLNANFSGEKVPLEILDVREKLDRELMVNTYWQSNTLLFHKRANRYFPIIEPILKKYGIPNDFKYLAVIESGLDNVVSPAGATGFWQLMKGSAGEYNLEINDNIDERYNIKKSTEAACKYLKEAYKMFGNWTLAAASYNLGKSGLYKQLERQKVNNYYDLLLNSETSRYLYRIIAVKEILSNSTKYGYVYRKSDLYPPIPTKTIEISEEIADLAVFAKEKNINYKILKILNPWLRDNVLPNKTNKTYRIELPTGELTDFKALDTTAFKKPTSLPIGKSDTIIAD